MREAGTTSTRGATVRYPKRCAPPTGGKHGRITGNLAQRFKDAERRAALQRKEVESAANRWAGCEQTSEEGICPRPLALLYGAPKVDASARWPFLKAFATPPLSRTADEGMPISSGIMRPPRTLGREG